ncbi:MAG TPA: gamma-glutamylcyclotransferase [Gammaproteobacteria bacterium]|nr:gamma-glutamylcyclotransferase [Gammaproteobacteria bacterium]
MLQQIILPKQPLWIFAYGSLMWNPGFTYAEKQTVRIYGHHRALCVWSWHYRGSREQPGLVFGLDQGGSCVGKAFRIKAKDQKEVLQYLYAREMITQVYRPSLVTIHLVTEDEIQALTFVVDRRHPQYAGHLHHDILLQTIQRAHGSRGPNHEYVRNTLDHLKSIGYQDRQLQRLGMPKSVPDL